MEPKFNIAVLGLWHLGEIFSTGLAELGHTVLGVSDDEKLIANFSKNIPPLAEPRLEELINKNQSEGRLSYTTDFSRIKECNVLWLTFDTPVDDKDEVDLSVIFEAIEKAIPHLQNNVLIVMTSQIPVGTSQKIIALIKTKCLDITFDYAYTPENLRLGDAVKCFLEPGRIVVGASSETGFQKMRDIFKGLNVPLLEMSPASAEMAKHALNAFLATTISFANDIGDVCERMGADAEDVVKALRTDPRVGPKAYLFSGLGFSGGTLGRDLKALLKTADEQQLELPVIVGVVKKNQSRNPLVRARLEQVLGPLKGKTLAMFGVTYKAGTSTLRRSQALEVEKELRDAGASLRLHDPLAKKEEVAVVTPSPFFSDPYEAAQGVEAIIVLTPTPDFRTLDFARLKAATKNPLLYDTGNILYPKEKEIVASGLQYMRMGK